MPEPLLLRVVLKLVRTVFKVALPSTAFPESSFFSYVFSVEYLIVRPLLKPYFYKFLSDFRFFNLKSMKRSKSFAFHNL